MEKQTVRQKILLKIMQASQYKTFTTLVIIIIIIVVVVVYLYSASRSASNALSRKGDPWDDVSHCNSWQVATKNEGSEPSHTFLAKVCNTCALSNGNISIADCMRLSTRLKWSSTMPPPRLEI